jgi:hypothetical protein
MTSRRQQEPAPEDARAGPQAAPAAEAAPRETESATP